MQLARLLSLALAGHGLAKSLLQVLTANSDELSTLSDALSKTPGAAQMFGELKNITLFAPSNDALKQFTAKEPGFAQLAANTTAISQLLMYHVVPMILTSKNITPTAMFMSTLLGGESMSPTAAAAAGININTNPPAAETSMDMNMRPPAADTGMKMNMSAPAAGTGLNMNMSGPAILGMNMSASAAGIGSNMNMNISAPTTLGTNLSAPAMSRGMRSRDLGAGATTGPGAQVVGVQLVGKTAMVISGFRQTSAVTRADLAFDGGVVHIVDKVLTVPQPPSVTALDAGLTSLYGALKKAGMVAAVDALPMGATVFAPSNKAFEAVGSVVEGASVQDLMAVLAYHTVRGMGMPMFSTSLMGMTNMMPGMTGMNMQKRNEVVTMDLATLQGGNLTVRVDENKGELFINSAKVVTSDIITSNGVVHVIDNVLNPMAANAEPNPAAATQAPAFAGATPAKDAPFTQGVTATTTIIPATTAAPMSKENGAAGIGPFAAVPTAALLAGGVAVALANL